jgi:pterin-4a-carbinolamine dehydratase
MPALNARQIKLHLKDIPDWSKRAQTICRTFKFEGFMTGIDFVRRIAKQTLKMNHQPDIDVRFDRVTLTLTTHDEGGLTEKDFSLARKCDEVFSRFLACIINSFKQKKQININQAIIMNTNTKSKHAANAPFLKIISKSASATLGMVLLAVGLLVPCTPTRKRRISMADTNFILAAAQGGMTEVKLGELAATNGMREDVKDFGQMMVKDHTAINDDLKTLAAQKGVTLPDSLDAKHQAMVDKLAALTGSEFDDALSLPP